MKETSSSNTIEAKTEEQQEILFQEHRRKIQTRRRLAYFAMFQCVTCVLILLFAPIPTPHLEIIATPITWFILGSLGLVGAHMGVETVYPDKNVIR